MDSEALARWVAELMRQRHIPGAAYGVIRGGRILHAAGLGVTDISSGAPVSEATPFAIGSVTKLVTALAILRASEAGAVDLDAPAWSYFPHITAPHDRSTITCKMLLSHTSGLGNDWREVERYDPAALDLHLEELLHAPLAFSPGEVPFYSNLGYNWLGLVLQAVRRVPYVDAITRDVLAPAGMRGSFDPRIAISRGAALSHRRTSGQLIVEPGLPQLGAYLPSAGLFCSLADLLALATALLAPHSDRPLLISPETLATMCSVHAPTFGFDGGGVGLGLFVEFQRGARIATLVGAIGNVTCSIALVPEQGAGVVLLQNRASDGFRETTLERLLSTALDTDRVPRAPAAPPAPISPSHAGLSGDYLCPRLGLLRVRVAGAELDVCWNDAVMLQEHVHADSYRLWLKDAKLKFPLSFIRGSDGQARYAFFQRWPFVRIAGTLPAAAEFEPVPQLRGRFSNGFTSFSVSKGTENWELRIEDSALAYPLIALSPERWASRAGVVEWRPTAEGGAIHWATQRFEPPRASD